MKLEGQNGVNEVWNGAACSKIFLITLEKLPYLREDCSGCVKNYKYAKKHKKRIIYNSYTEDIIGVEI